MLKPDPPARPGQKRDKAADFGKLSGTVEVDETYVGGLEKNKHRDKKLRADRGAVGKMVVAEVRSHHKQQVRAAVVPRASSPILKAFVRRNAKRGSTLYTDELPAYGGMGEYFRDSVAHGKGKYVRYDVHTNCVGSFWAILERGYKGTYHQMSPEYLKRYVAEFSARPLQLPEAGHEEADEARGLGDSRAAAASEGADEVIECQ